MILNKKITPYIYIAFFLCSFHGIFSQGLTLKLISKDSVETSILETLSFQKKHRLEKEVYIEIRTVHEKIKRKGFFTSSLIDVIKKENGLYLAVFSLGKKTEEVIILPSKALRSKFKLKDSVSVRTEKLEDYIKSLLTLYDKEGKSFTELNLIEPTIKNDKLFIKLYSKESNNRNITKVVFKEYENFPRSFLKNYFKIDSKSIFSKQKLREISNQTKSLSFVNEIKPPEVLFKKDSTVLYLFLKKVKSNSIDGIINFASEENSNGLFLNGNLDLKLNNILNTGENFKLFWNRVGNEKSEFLIDASIPYIFNSSFSTGVGFNIYRQDSTFLNTKFNFDIKYDLSSRIGISIYYNSESSDYLLDTSSLELDSYSNYFLGLGFNYIKPVDSYLFNNKFSFSVTPSVGKRKGNNLTSNQFKVESKTEANFKTSSKTYINIRAHTGYLDSKNLILNEFFRIGGANSIRGFNEQSIFASKFAYTNLEYRVMTSRNSYIYSVTDLGFTKQLDSNQSILGLGFGYLFTIKNSQVNLAYVVGKDTRTNFDFNNSKLNIIFKSFF